MRFAITAQDGKGDFSFSNSGPWTEFKDALEEQGHEVVALSEKPNAIVFNNFSRTLYNRFAQETGGKNLFLVAWEPKSNLPHMFKSKNLAKFNYRFFPSPIWCAEFDGRYFDWPQGEQSTTQVQDWHERLDKVCMIQGNRWSFQNGELYSLRRDLVKLFGSDLDLYGFGWNQGLVREYLSFLNSLFSGGLPKINKFEQISQVGYKYPNYRGQVTNKLEVMALYKYALVIENSSEYLSEKLIDALLAGAVPIYVGTNLEQFRLPKDVAITVDPNPTRIMKVISKLRQSEGECKNTLNSGRAFLKSPRFKEISNSFVLSNLAREISKLVQ